MKILKIFGIVVGIHVFALILIFANPGCSSTTRPAPVPSDTVGQSDVSPVLSVPQSSAVVSGPGNDPYASSAPIDFNPDAPAVAASSNSMGGVRYTPTRPNSPAAANIVAEPVADVTPARTYTVVSGDNLWEISKRNHLTVAELAAANGLRANAVLRVGQKLIIPGKPASPTAAARAQPAKSAPETAVTVAPKPAPADAFIHVVKRGETLSTIARRYEVSQRQIAIANNITDPQRIPEGMKLVIPGWQATPSAKGSSKSAPDTAPATTPPSSTQQSRAPVIPQEQPAPKQEEIPVIRIDESPLTPAPQN